MTVTKDVIRDLMPLYLAGECSSDTRRLVEEFLRAHPEESLEEDTLALPKVSPPAGLEMTSLEHTRKIFGWRSMALAAAFAVSYSVFSFRFSGDGLVFVMYRDLPVVTYVLLAVAVAIWIVFFVLHRRWFATGLVGSSQSAQGVWMLGGVLAMLPYAFAASYRLGLDDVRALCVVGAFAGRAIQKALQRGPASA